MHRDLRAGIGAFFDRYFTLSLHSDDVPQADIDALLEMISKPNEFSRVCESLMRMGKLDKAFDRLDAYNCNLSKHDFPAIITSLADVGDTLPHAEWATAQTADALQNSWRLILFSLRSMEDENRRFVLLRDGLSASQGVRLVVHVAARQERIKGRSTSDFLISEDQAIELKGLALERIRAAASDGRHETCPTFSLCCGGGVNGPAIATRLNHGCNLNSAQPTMLYGFFKQSPT